MSIQQSIIFRSFVQPFYKKNVALLCFFVFMMTLAVGRANGVGLLEYHYALIKGIMTSGRFLAVVFAIWFAYGAWCISYFNRMMKNPAFSYLHLLSMDNRYQTFGRLFTAQLVLFLPVLSYACVMVWIGYLEHWHRSANLVVIFNMLICAGAAGYYQYKLHRPTKTERAWMLPTLPLTKSYPAILAKHILENHKLLLVFTKLYSCSTLYLMLDNNNGLHFEDLRMTALFFAVGILGHGILVHRVKEMENKQLLFYRSLPVSLNRRFSQYAIFYFCLFLPELMVIVSRTPYYTSFEEAIFFLVFGYSLLLLLNSTQLYNYKSLKDYLVVVVQIFFLVIIAIIADQLYLLAVAISAGAVFLFYRRFYRFDPVAA